MILGATTFGAAQVSPGGVKEFAAELASSRIPAGIVAPEPEISRGESQSRPPGTNAGNRGLRMRIADFNASHPSYRATVGASAVRVEPKDAPSAVVQLLERHVTIETTRAVPASEALFRTLVGAIIGAPVGGLIGTGIMPGPECPLSAPVRMPSGTRTVAEYLDDIATQARTVWLLTYDPDNASNDPIKVGFVCPGGGTLRLLIEQ